MDSLRTKHTPVGYTLAFAAFDVENLLSVHLLVLMLMNMLMKDWIV